jgi:hypothetical protein
MATKLEGHGLCIATPYMHRIRNCILTSRQMNTTSLPIRKADTDSKTKYRKSCRQTMPLLFKDLDVEQERPNVYKQQSGAIVDQQHGEPLIFKTPRRYSSLYTTDGRESCHYQIYRATRTHMPSPKPGNEQACTHTSCVFKCSGRRGRQPQNVNVHVDTFHDAKHPAT